MSDDSFFREVNEEIRQDQARALWDRFGAFVIAAAILVVVGTAAFVGWEYWRESRSGGAGDAFTQALNLAKEGKNDEAVAALQKIEQDGHGAYPMLAKMRTAGVLAEKGDAAGAVAAFDAVAADNSADPALRDVARLRAALVLVDSGSYGDVQQRAGQLAVDTNPLRNPAREALGLSAWKDGKGEEATKLFEQIAADLSSSQNQRQRANLMIDLIRGGSTAGS